MVFWWGGFMIRICFVLGLGLGFFSRIVFLGIVLRCERFVLTHWFVPTLWISSLVYLLQLLSYDALTQGNMERLYGTRKWFLVFFSSFRWTVDTKWTNALIDNWRVVCNCNVAILPVFGRLICLWNMMDSELLVCFLFYVHASTL